MSMTTFLVSNWKATLFYKDFLHHIKKKLKRITIKRLIWIESHFFHEEMNEETTTNSLPLDPLIHDAFGKFTVVMDYHLSNFKENVIHDIQVL